MTLGLTVLEYFDTPPLPDISCYYVVEAEDDAMMSRCIPAGPTNGGSTARVAANGGVRTAIIDRLAPALDALPRIDESLRVGGTDPISGARRYSETSVQMFWTPDRNADVIANEHFHVYRSNLPNSNYSTVTDDLPPEYENEFLDLIADQLNDGQAHVWSYLVFTADDCDGENIDYDRLCTGC